MWLCKCDRYLSIIQPLIIAILCQSSDIDTQFNLPRGSALLSHIYTALLNEDFTRTPVYFELLLVLMDVTCRPLFQWLGCWLGVQSDETVDAFRWVGDPWQPRDPYNEFFIVYANSNEGQASEVQVASQSLALHLSAGDTFWNTGYQVIVIPSVKIRINIKLIIKCHLVI
jgi:hypothetical protein